MPLMRLQKFLSQAGVCSRRQGESLIREGAVTVNGRRVTALGTKIDPDVDRVAVRGERIEGARTLLYIALNKPRGYVTTCRQPGEKIVLDLIDIAERIFRWGGWTRIRPGCCF